MLKFSSSTTLWVICTPEDVATPNEHLILPILSAHFNDPIPIKFRSFQIHVDYIRHAIDMFASTLVPTPPFPDILADMDIDAELNLSLSFLRVHDFTNIVEMFLKRACEVLPLSKVEFLSIFSLAKAPRVNWGEVFRHLTEITTVRLDGHGTTNLLPALTLPQSSRGKGRKRRRADNNKGVRARAPDEDDNHGPAAIHVPIFPKLTSLLLELQDFNDMVPGSGVLFDLILSIVKLRKAKKTPLSRLCITDCVINEEQANALEEVVPDFWWDLYDKDEDDEEDSDYD